MNPPIANPAPTPRKAPSTIVNLLFNIAIPTLILTKFSKEEYLGPIWGLLVALAFPVIYGIRDYVVVQRGGKHKPNLFSLIGVVSILLTGSMSLLKLDAQYIAIKEAAIPGLIGLATLISVYTRYPLVRVFLYNEQVMQIDKVAAALQQHNTTTQFDKRLKIASYLVASSFFLSSFLNYALAKYILVSAPGTSAYTEELGKMTALSFPVIALPSTLVLMLALFYLLNGIQKLTHLQLEDIFKHN
ncbi:MAG: VC0807 family protein [Spongiibacteraceae bacterium]